MSLKSFYNEEQVKLSDEQTLRLVVDFRAIDAIETLTDVRMDNILPQVLTGTAKLGLIGKVLWGLMRKHHGDAGLDEAAGLMLDKDVNQQVGMAMNALLMRAFNIELESRAKAENPRKRRGASKAS